MQFSICYFNFVEFPALDKMQSSTQFNSRWILELINRISSDLYKLLKYFNGTTNFVFFTELFVLLTVSAVFPTMAALYLNDSKWKTPLLLTAKSTLLPGGSSLLNYHKIPDVFE